MASSASSTESSSAAAPPPTPRWRIRDAQATDAATIHAMIRELAEFEREPHEVATTVEQLREDGWGATPRFVCFLAEIEGDACDASSTTLGMALCFFGYSTWKGLMLYLEDLYVKPAYRHAGVGKSLITHCVRYAADPQRNCQRVQWSVLDWNTRAREFYAKLGTCELNEWIPVRMTRAHMEEYLRREDAKAEAAGQGANAAKA